MARLKIKRKYLVITFALLTALGVTTMFITGCFSKQQIAVGQASLVKVNYLELQDSEVVITSKLPGRVSPFMVSEVRPQVSGIIQSRLFEEGSDVQAGQILYQIDPSLYQASYNSAKANLAKAKANAEAANLLAQRYQSALRTSAVSKQDYDDAKAAAGHANAEVAAAQAALETARINLDYTKVASPISGRISRSQVTPGALVTQNQAAALTTVQQLNPVYVDVTQSSMEMLHLRQRIEQGQLKVLNNGASTKVSLIMEDGSVYGYHNENGDFEAIEGELLFSDVTVSASTGTVNIRIKVANPQGVLLPGMYIRGELNEGTRESALLIPQKAVMRDNRGRPMVYVLSKTAEQPLNEDEFVVEMRMLNLDRSINHQWLVNEGVAAHELLLTDGLQKVRPGQMVQGVKLPGQSTVAEIDADSQEG